MNVVCRVVLAASVLARDFSRRRPPAAAPGSRRRRNPVSRDPEARSRQPQKRTKSVVVSGSKTEKLINARSR